MTTRKLSRTAYRDPTQVGSPVRSGDTTHGESNADAEGYIQPIAQVHASGLHDWGVAQGLKTTATIGAAGITVEPGTAVDVNGRHIALAASTPDEASFAEVSTVDPPDPAVPAQVTATGVLLPTVTVPQPAAGDYVVTVQWLERFDLAALGSPTGAVWRYADTPWLRLRAAATFVDNGEQVALARVTLDATGKVTALTHGLRRVVGVPVQSVRLRAASTASGGGKSSGVEAEAGELRVRRGAGGAPAGVEIVSANAADEIHLKAKGASPDAPVAKIQLSATTVAARSSAGVDTVVIASASGDLSAHGVVRAPQFIARRADGKESVLVDAQLGNVVAGTTGIEGDVLVKNAANALTITLDGAAGDVVVGGTATSGNVRVWNSERTERINLDGATGDLNYFGRLRDISQPLKPGTTHSQLRELTEGGYSGLHKHKNSGNASMARGVWMSVDNGTTVSTISFGSPRQMVATIAISAFDPRADFDSGDAMYAEIYRVDGADFRAGGWFHGGAHLGSDGDDANLRSCFFNGVASSITFRLRSMQDATVKAVGMVFPEFT